MSTLLQEACGTFVPKPQRWRDAMALVYCSLITPAILGVLLTVFLALLVELWPYKLNLTQAL